MEVSTCVRGRTVRKGRFRECGWRAGKEQHRQNEEDAWCQDLCTWDRCSCTSLAQCYLIQGFFKFIWLVQRKSAHSLELLIASVKAVGRFVRLQSMVTQPCSEPRETARPHICSPILLY